MTSPLRKASVRVVLLLSGALGLSALAGAAAPKISFKEEAWNFGRAKGGEDLVHEFVFKNAGDAPLNIKNVETSCGCTAALVSDKLLAPGKSGKIKVTFNTRGYSGEVVKFIYVESDDPANSRIQLKITAAVEVPPQPRIDLDHYSFDAGLLVEGEDLKTSVLVRNRGELELDVECSLPGGSFFFGGKPAVFPAKIAAGKDLEIQIKSSLANEMGPLRKYVMIKSNDLLRSAISLTISGYIVTKEQLKQIFLKYKDILK